MFYNPFDKTIYIGTKPPQSGKTKEFIIDPTLSNIRNNIFTIIVVPSRIALEKQLVHRLTRDSGKDKSFFGRYDTGIPPKDRLGSPGDVLRDFKSKKLGVVIVLNNAQGIKKLNELLVSIIETSEPLHIIMDEAHSVLGSMDSILQKYREMDFWCLTGTTATLTGIPRDLDVDIKAIRGVIPSGYIGYPDVSKCIYKKTLDDAFRKIIFQRKGLDKTIVMSHVGHSNEQHNRAGNLWLDTCINSGIAQCCYITDNQDGYSIWTPLGLIARYKKNQFDEPWNVLEQINYTHIGIFGDVSMAESNTYQKCDENHNVYISDLVVCSNKYNLDTTFKLIQKVGRLFTNDTVNKNFIRSLWFPDEDTRKRLDQGFEYELRVQDKAIKQSLNSLNYKFLRKQVIEDDVQRIIDEAEEAFPRWARSDTYIISNIMKSVDPYKVYSRFEFANFLASQTKSDISVLITNLTSYKNHGYYGKIFQEVYDGYRLYPELIDLHWYYFIYNKQTNA